MHRWILCHETSLSTKLISLPAGRRLYPPHPPQDLHQSPSRPSRRGYDRTAIFGGKMHQTRWRRRSKGVGGRGGRGEGGGYQIESTNEFNAQLTISKLYSDFGVPVIACGLGHPHCERLAHGAERVVYEQGLTPLSSRLQFIQIHLRMHAHEVKLIFEWT